MQDYNNEADRLLTFHDWTDTILDRKLLARRGFFALGCGESVRCYFCGFTIQTWHRNDNILHRHVIGSPCCSLLNRAITYNQPINPIVFNLTVPPLKDAFITAKYG